MSRIIKLIANSMWAYCRKYFKFQINLLLLNIITIMFSKFQQIFSMHHTSHYQISIMNAKQWLDCSELSAWPLDNFCQLLILISYHFDWNCHILHQNNDWLKFCNGMWACILYRLSHVERWSGCTMYIRLLLLWSTLIWL